MSEGKLAQIVFCFGVSNVGAESLLACYDFDSGKVPHINGGVYNWTYGGKA